MTTKTTADVLRKVRTALAPTDNMDEMAKGVRYALALLDSVQAGEEVTEDRFSETVGSEILADEWPSLTQMQQHDLIFLQLGEFFPNGLKIVRGEKS